LRRIGRRKKQLRARNELKRRLRDAGLRHKQATRKRSSAKRHARRDGRQSKQRRNRKRRSVAGHEQLAVSNERKMVSVMRMMITTTKTRTVI